MFKYVLIGKISILALFCKEGASAEAGVLSARRRFPPQRRVFYPSQGRFLLSCNEKMLFVYTLF